MPGLPIRYAMISFLAHVLFILLASVPGWRAAPLVSSDAVTYVMDADNLLQHGVFSREQSPPYLWEPYRTPGYPLILAFSKLTTGSFELTLFFAAITAGLAAWVSVQMSILLGCSRTGQHIAGLVMTLSPNSLGLSAFLLTDAIFGHLFLIWIYLLYLGFSKKNKSALVASGIGLIILQAIKPTSNLGGLFVIAAGILFARRWNHWFFTASLAGISILIPLFFATMNYRDNGIFSPSLLGAQTAREYLQVRYLAEESGQEISQMTTQIRSLDQRSAGMLSKPDSFYGRLYLVSHTEVIRFLQQHPLRVLWLMVGEMIKQFAAPQEFAFTVFKTEPPFGIRVLGSILSILLWGGAGMGVVKIAGQGDYRPAIFLFGVLAFFLVTGSVSHFVGARLRFPADLLAIPYFSYGISTLSSINSRLNPFNEFIS